MTEELSFNSDKEENKEEDDKTDFIGQESINDIDSHTGEEQNVSKLGVKKKHSRVWDYFYFLAHVLLFFLGKLIELLFTFFIEDGKAFK